MSAHLVLNIDGFTIDQLIAELGKFKELAGKLGVKASAVPYRVNDTLWLDLPEGRIRRSVLTPQEPPSTVQPMRRARRSKAS